MDYFICYFKLFPGYFNPGHFKYELATLLPATLNMVSKEKTNACYMAAMLSDNSKSF